MYSKTRNDLKKLREKTAEQERMLERHEKSKATKIKKKTLSSSIRYHSENFIPAKKNICFNLDSSRGGE